MVSLASQIPAVYFLSIVTAVNSPDIDVPISFAIVALLSLALREAGMEVSELSRCPPNAQVELERAVESAVVDHRAVLLCCPDEVAMADWFLPRSIPMSKECRTFTRHCDYKGMNENILYLYRYTLILTISSLNGLFVAHEHPERTNERARVVGA